MREIIIEGITSLVKDYPANSHMVGVVSGASELRKTTTAPLKVKDISELIKVMLNSMPLGSAVRILIEVESPKEQIESRAIEMTTQQKNLNLLNRLINESEENANGTP